jgi:hypothetical protein
VVDLVDLKKYFADLRVVSEDLYLLCTEISQDGASHNRWGSFSELHIHQHKPIVADSGLDFLPMALTLSVCIAWYDPNIKPRRKTDIEFDSAVRE